MKRKEHGAQIARIIPNGQIRLIFEAILFDDI